MRCVAARVRLCRRVVIGAEPARTILAPHNAVADSHPADDPETCLARLRDAVIDRADLSGISRPTMHFLLTSRSSVGVDTIAKIADALGKHPSALLAPRDGASKRKR